MIIDSIIVRSVQIYVEKDKDGYLNLATDGYLPGGRLDEIIKILRDAQDEDDREYERHEAQRELEMRAGTVRY